MRIRWAALAAAFTLALAGCGDGDEPAAPPADPQPPAATTTVPPAEPTPAATTASPAAGRPAAGTCAEVPAPSDGNYTVADAGTAVVQRQNDRLVVGRIAPAAGWTHEVTEREADEVEIEFRRDGVEIDLEVEIDGGRIEAEVCTDDDD